MVVAIHEIQREGSVQFCMSEPDIQTRTEHRADQTGASSNVSPAPVVFSGKARPNPFNPRITQTLTVHSPNNKALGVSVCRAALLRVRTGGLPPVSICFVQFILEQIFIYVKHNKIKHVYRLLPHRQIFCGNMAAILVHTRCASYTQLNSSQFPIKIIW